MNRVERRVRDKRQEEKKPHLSRDVTRDAVVAMEEQDPQFVAPVQQLLDDKVVDGSHEAHIQHSDLVGLLRQSVNECVRVEFVARVEVEVLERVGRVGHGA